MASVIQQHPPSSYYTPSNELEFTTPSNTTAVVPPSLERQDSLATVDMHIPGAWVGTNPPTPAPIQEDMANLGKQLQTLPRTVQGYIPSREQAAQHASNLKEMVAAAVPASVTNAATNILPSSVQPTMSPTAADAAPPVPSTDEHPITTTTNTTKHQDPTVPVTDTSATGSSLMDKAAALLPAGALGAAAAILPSSMNPTANPTAADAQPPAESKDIPATSDETQKATTQEDKSSWTEKLVPAGALAAAGAYLPTTLNPFAIADNEGGPTPYGTHEGLNAPLPKIPSSSDTALPASTAAMHSDPQPLIGSTVSPDNDVQEALKNAKNPEDYKVEVTPAEAVTEPTIASIDATKTATGTIGDQDSIVESTRAVGGTTPIPTPAAESSGKRENIAEVLGGGAVGAFAVDRGLKKQREDATTVPNNASNRSRLIETNDSFQHVITPATPFAGEHEGELWQKKGASEGASRLDTTKKNKKERSESVSAGEASPSSPSKTGVFGGIKKLTKKKQRSKSRAHSRDVSMDDNKPEEVISPATHQASLDSQDSNSSGPGVSPSSPTKKQHNVLHKDPPTAHEPIVDTDIAGDNADPAPNANIGSASTPNALANPFSTSVPPASPSKASIKDKLKGEFMVVSGTLTRDSGLKEAGKKMKEGTL